MATLSSAYRVGPFDRLASPPEPRRPVLDVPPDSATTSASGGRPDLLKEESVTHRAYKASNPPPAALGGCSVGFVGPRRGPGSPPPRREGPPDRPGSRPEKRPHYSHDSQKAARSRAARLFCELCEYCEGDLLSTHRWPSGFPNPSNHGVHETDLGPTGRPSDLQNLQMSPRRAWTRICRLCRPLADHLRTESPSSRRGRDPPQGSSVRVANSEWRLWVTVDQRPSADVVRISGTQVVLSRALDNAVTRQAVRIFLTLSFPVGLSRRGKADSDRINAFASLKAHWTRSKWRLVSLACGFCSTSESGSPSTAAGFDGSRERAGLVPEVPAWDFDGGRAAQSGLTFTFRNSIRYPSASSPR